MHKTYLSQLPEMKVWHLGSNPEEAIPPNMQINISNKIGHFIFNQF